MLLAFTIIILTIGVGLYIAYPLLADAGGMRRHFRARAEDLRVRRDQLFHDIRELEFDLRMGKLTDEDYAQLLDQLKGEAAVVLDEIERVEKAGTKNGKAASRRRAPAANMAADTDADIEAQIAARKRRAVKTVVACPSCGAQNPEGARFCNKCGAALAVETKGTA